MEEPSVSAHGSPGFAGTAPAWAGTSLAMLPVELHAHCKPGDRRYRPYFTDGETEAGCDRRTWPGSNSQKVAEAGWPDPKAIRNVEEPRTVLPIADSPPAQLFSKPVTDGLSFFFPLTFSHLC